MCLVVSWRPWIFISLCSLSPWEVRVARCYSSRSRWRKQTALLSFLQACSKPSRVSGIPDMSDVPIAQGLKHCSLRDTEACLPRALCSPGWKQLISNCLHSNCLIVQKHCLVFQFSLSHCLPEGLFTALSLIWVGGVPVGEVNCQDRKNTMVARSWGALSLTGPTCALNSVKTKSYEGLTFSPTFFCLPENCHFLHQARNYEDFFFLFPWEAV